MLLVQQADSLKAYLSLMFQYIICCWFNLVFLVDFFVVVVFQYIICCWFKKRFVVSLKRNFVSIHYMLLVQEDSAIIFGRVAIVSIHYMLLVQQNQIFSVSVTKHGFNTLYVVGSTRKNRAFKIPLSLKMVSQSYFSNHFSNFNN